MTPYYERGGITIYHGDCRDVLPTLESVDFILTDPPYGQQYVTARRSRTDPLVAPIQGDDSLNSLRDAMPILDQLLRPERHAYVFAGWSQVGDAVDAVSSYWKVKNLLIWDKGEAGSVGDLEAGFGVNWEAVIYASKGRRVLTGPRPRAILRYEWSSTRDPVHPTVKPIGLLTRLIAMSTVAGELILDPFMGSGTTLAAAQRLGRRAIGIEIEERYCEIAAKRLAQQPMDFDAPAPPPAKQEALL